MASENQGGGQRAPGPGSGPRRVAVRPGSVNRGFASMDPERQREIASQGGKLAQEGGDAHEPAPEEPREAARQRRESGGSRAAARQGRGARGGRAEPIVNRGEDGAD